MASDSAAAPSVLLPVDEAARNPSFFGFRAQLLAAIARRDTGALLAAVYPRIKNSFGGNDGIVEFRRLWKLKDPRSRIWNELGTALALGGSFDAQGRFIAPYVFSRWPEKIDAFENVAVIGDKVRIRSAAKPDAATLTSVDFAILRLAPRSRPPAGGPAEWTAVVLPDGRRGYVQSRIVRSPVGYRAIFTRSASGWRLTNFVSGD